MNLEVHKQGEQTTSKEQMEVLDKKKNEYKLVGQMRRRRGLILYQFNPSNGELKEVELNTKVSVGLDGKAHYHSEAKIGGADLMFFWALNRKNAEKKVNKIINQLN